MAGHFTDRTAWTRGRPLVEVPPSLAEILDATYRENRDYVVTADEDDEEAQQLIRYGRLHARHKGLSFRYYFSENERGVTVLRFRLADKRRYVKKDPTYWDGK